MQKNNSINGTGIQSLLLNQAIKQASKQANQSINNLLTLTKGIQRYLTTSLEDVETRRDSTKRPDL